MTNNVATALFARTDIISFLFFIDITVLLWYIYIEHFPRGCSPRVLCFLTYFAMISIMVLMLIATSANFVSMLSTLSKFLSIPFRISAGFFLLFTLSPLLFFTVIILYHNSYTKSSVLHNFCYICSFAQITIVIFV